MAAMDDQDAVFDALVEQFDLPDAHSKLVEAMVEDVFEMHHTAAKRAQEIEKLKKQLSKLEYMLVKRVGSGAYGSVYQGVRKSDQKAVAIKVIDLEESGDDIMVINREIVALTQGRICEQLVQYYGSQVFGTDLWIIMEFCDGGSILNLVNENGYLTERHIAVIVREVLLGLRYLWNDNKVHRDIKAANILLTRLGAVKLADFGASGELSQSMRMATFVGSPNWMAPEQFTEQKYDKKVDVWALGITCIEMAKGKPPHHTKPSVQVPQLIVNNSPPKLEGEFSRQFKNFVQMCLCKDPRNRPSVDMLLKHPFVKKSEKTHILQELFELSDKLDDADLLDDSGLV